MRILTVSGRIEARCNICLQWIWGGNYDKRLLNACPACLLRLLRQEVLLCHEGEGKYRVLLIEVDDQHNVVDVTAHTHKQQLTDIGGIQHRGKGQQQGSMQGQICPYKTILLDEIEDIKKREIGTIAQKWQQVIALINGQQQLTLTKTDNLKAYINRIRNVKTYPISTNQLDLPTKKPRQLFINKIQQQLHRQAQDQSPKHQQQQRQHTKQTQQEYVHEIGQIVLKDITQQICAISNVPSRYQSAQQETKKCNLKNQCQYKFYFDHEPTLELDSACKENGQDWRQLNLCTQASDFKPRPRNHTKRSAIQTKTKQQRSQEVKQRIAKLLEPKGFSQSYARLLAVYLKSAYDNTKVTTKTLQLISFDLGIAELSVYLQLFDCTTISVLKLINAGLMDVQAKQLFDFVATKKIQIIVLTGNRFTEAILTTLSSKTIPHLRQIYLGRNKICRAKETIMEVRNKYILHL